MGKRIRHLEFYGYTDQNVYMGLPNVDLSDIRETNKEQDKEINAISGATSGKADKATVDSLSGKVDTFIDKQDKINKWLAKGINKNRERIDKLESRDREITDKINEIVDDFNPIYDELGNLSSKIDSVDDKLNQHISQESTFEEETDARLDSLDNKIDKKLDEREAYDTFAKKSDVYIKQEVDDKIAHIGDEYATEEWVLNRGFITETDADGKYATITTVDGKVDKTDISTTISSTPSDEKVVSEKAVKTELNKKVDNTIILKTVDEVNSFDRAYQSFIVYNFIADAIGLPGSPSSTWFCIHLSHSKGYQYPSQIAFEYAGLKRIMYRISIKGVWDTWRKISTTGVKDIPKTNIAPADTTKFVGFKGNSLCNYCVQNGICYVSIWGVQVTVTGRVNTGVILPLPKSGFFGGGHHTGGGDAETHAYAHTIPETGELKFNVKDANTALYGAFSYPVAES